MLHYAGIYTFNSWVMSGNNDQHVIAINKEMLSNQQKTYNYCIQYEYKITKEKQ